MSFKARINQFRRTVFRSLTKNILNSRIDEKAKDLVVKRILIIRPNHRLGNLLLITPLIQEVAATFPEAKIDLFIKGGVGPAIFKNYKCIHNIFALPKKPFQNLLAYSTSWIKMIRGRYDLVINAVSNSSSGKLATRLIDAPMKISGQPDPDPSADAIHSSHIALRPVLSFRQFVSRIGLPSAEPFPYLDIKLSSAEIASGKAILNKLAGHDKPAIALYTYATGSKCFPPEWWASFLSE